MQINKVSSTNFRAVVKPQQVIKRMDNPVEKFVKEEAEHLHDFYPQTTLNNVPLTRSLAPQYYADQADIASIRFNHMVDKKAAKETDNPMKKFVEETDSLHDYKSASMKA